MSKPIEIKVRGCDGCPLLQGDWMGVWCNHPKQVYEGDDKQEMFNHCPLKETETIIKFERDGKLV